MDKGVNIESIMKLPYSKLLTKSVMREQVVSEWVRPKGYDLSAVTISLPIFKISLNLVLGDFDEFSRFIKDTFDVECKDCAKAYFCCFNDKDKVHWNWILIQRNDWRAEDYGTLAHELHHFVHSALDETGVAYGTAGEEVYAYMQGYFMELVVRAFIMLGKVKKK